MKKLRKRPSSFKVAIWLLFCYNKIGDFMAVSFYWRNKK